MCWKHEWARAVNNLEWAKIHIQRAREKVTLRNLDLAAGECTAMLVMLTGIQEGLKDLIEEYGISKKARASSLETHLKGRRVKSGKVAAWVKTN